MVQLSVYPSNNNPKSDSTETHKEDEKPKTSNTTTSVVFPSELSFLSVDHPENPLNVMIDKKEEDKKKSGKGKEKIITVQPTSAIVSTKKEDPEFDCCSCCIATGCCLLYVGLRILAGS